MKYLTRIVLFLCLLMVLSIGAIDFLLTTQTGFKTMVKVAKRLLPGDLFIEEIQGSLNKQITLQNIYYKNAYLTFSCKQLQISVQPLSWLTHGNFTINAIQVDTANIMYVTQPVEQNNARPFDLQNLIRKLGLIKIKDIRLQTININYNGKIFLIKKLLVNTLQNQTNILLDSTIGIISGVVVVDLTNNNNATWFSNLTVTHFNTNVLKQDIASDVAFQIKTIGQLKDNRLRFKAWLKNVAGNVRNYPLHGSGYLAYNQGNILFKRVNLTIANAHFTINGDLLQNKGNFNWEVAVPNLHEVLPNASGSIVSKGILKTNNNQFLINSFINANNLSVAALNIKKLSAKIQSTKLTAAMINATLTNIFFKNYQIQELKINDNVTYVAKTLLQDFNLIINHRNKIAGTFNLPKFMQRNLEQQALQGAIHVANIQASTLYQNKDLPLSDGIIDAQLNIAGTFAQPSFIGAVQLQHGKVPLSNLGITLENIHINANVNNNKPILIHGSMNSGNGAATIQGTIDFYNKQFPELRLNVTGQHFEVLNLKEYKLAISPQVSLENHGDTINLGGTVTIPYLRVITDYDKAVTLPSEITFIGRPNIKPSIPSQLAIKLNVILQDDVYIAYKKLRANLIGQINVQQIPGGIPTGLGEIYINKGEYRVYNRLLNIKDGRLIYVGNSLYNPGLNIEALKTVENTNFISSWLTSWFPKSAPDSRNNVVVGASVKGTLNDPEITLISYPSMSQQDILTYLLTGSGSASLGGSDGFSTVGVLASGLNLFGDGDEENSSPLGGLGSVAGGLFSSLQSLNFRLPLTKNLDIRTATTWDETGVDLNYSTEYE